MGLLDQASSSGNDEEARLRKHHVQIRGELKAQEDITDAAFAKYTEVAGKLSTLWKQNAEIVMFGDKAVRSITKDSKAYPEFQKLTLLKQEAHEAWQREANKHGRFIVAAEKVMDVLPPRFMAQGAS